MADTPRRKLSRSSKSASHAFQEQIRPGTCLGRYEIVELLGRGGMGEVYRAKDSRLGREVAIKVLPESVARDRDARLRFEREARLLAGLSHPNILTVHDFGYEQDRWFIAMELLEGETLRSRLVRSVLPWRKASEAGAAIAEGLGGAHAEGIVHRDLKPENIFLTSDGQVKILDFGLARFKSFLPSTDADSTLTVLTPEQGMVLGTVGYMSPEQVRGQETDARSDIFSLGCVLYEMASGRRAFSGATSVETMTAILKEDPPELSRPGRNVPPEFDRVILRCLEKNPNERFQSARDLAFTLKAITSDSGPSGPHDAQALPRFSMVTRPSSLLALTLVVFLSLGLIYSWVSRWQQPVESHYKLRLTQLTTGGGLAMSPSWSPDGKWISYASDEAGNLDIWKIPLDGGQPVQLTSTPENESEPGWSPDGRNIAFSSDAGGSGISLIPSDGGQPWSLTRFGASPVWSPDSRTLAFDWHGKIYLVPLTGGEPRLLVTGTSAKPYLVWSPDGKRLIFWHRTRGDVHVVSVEEGESQPLGLIMAGEEVSGLAWSKNGQTLVFSRGPFGGSKDLWKVPVDPQTGRPTGEPLPLSLTATDDRECAFSPDGSRLAFTVRQLERHLYGLRLDSQTATIKGELKQFTIRGQQNYYPALSPDGRKLVWTSHRAGKGMLYAKDLDGGEERKVTREWSRDVREVGSSFAPDNRQISYSSTVGDSYQIWRTPSAGSVGLPMTETRNPIRDSLTAWSPDGKTIAFYSNRSGNWDIWSVKTAGSEPERITHWESNEMYPVWSPDGAFLAFKTDKEGSGDIWITDPEGNNPRPLVADPAEEAWAAWSPDGRWFYFTSDRSGVFNVWIQPVLSGLPTGKARQLTTYQGLTFGLPDEPLFTKLAVSDSLLILPLERRRGDIYLLENLQ